MQQDIKKLSIRLLVLLVLIAMGITVILLWVVPRFRAASSLGALKVSDALKDEQVAVPDEWKELAIKNRVTLRLPRDMKPSELMGDSFAHREAYSNRDIKLTISYGPALPPRPNQRGDLFDPCDTPRSLLEESTYRESVINIDGKQVKLGINRYYQPKYILADVCFLKPTDKSEQLVVWAHCKDDHALATAQQIFNSIRFIDGN